MVQDGYIEDKRGYASNTGEEERGSVENKSSIAKFYPFSPGEPLPKFL
jgi:hypothetical protein